MPRIVSKILDKKPETTRVPSSQDSISTVDICPQGQLSAKAVRCIRDTIMVLGRCFPFRQPSPDSDRHLFVKKLAALSGNVDQELERVTEAAM